MFYKTHDAGGGRMMLAACDEGHLGKTYEEGERVLEVRPSFYHGKKADAERLRMLLSRAYIVNLVGEECVGLARDAGLVEKGTVLTVRGVPCVQVMLAGDP
ncbi:DUF424 family protein [Candidatus Woesearchaeota archaeon]|nr:DUF424 family protein [Candidatus Woesearchaeota archaeon]